MAHAQVAEMMQLFEGWTKNYGAYKLTGEVTEQGKVVGKTYSLLGEVTVELWDDHLRGRQGLGVIPITDESKVKFGAIDIDEYPLDLTALAMNVAQLKMPLVVCRTKSGGAHLYMFLTDWCSAKIAQQKLREMAAQLGYGQSEVFPKQVTILAERGDVGQWINMPYFRAEDTERYAVDDDGKKLTIEKFTRFAFHRMVDPESLVTRKFVDKQDEALHEGPPCLNHLVVKGFPPGTRNNGLFNLGVYAQKLDPDHWQTRLAEFNTKFMDPPLSPSEVQGVVKSLNKSKGYNYTCKQQPIVSFCNINKCRACKFGVGIMGVGMPKLGTLCKIATNPPIWFVDIEGSGRLELETEDLQFVKRYQTRCMDSLSIMPPLVKNELWSELIGKLMSDVTVVEVPEEATPKGVLKGFLDEFCTSRVQAKSREEMLLGKPCLEDERIYFRLRDLMAFLERQKFREFGINRVAVYLRDWGADKHFFNVKGKGINCYSLPEKMFKKVNEPLDTPTQVRKKDAF